MRRLLNVLTVVLVGAAAPSAFASTGDVTAVDIPLAGERTLSTTSDRSFTLVGIHWRGSGSVVFRTRSVDGAWSAWRAAAPEDEDGPDPGTAESRRRGSWRIGNPWWVGPSEDVQVRTKGRVARVRAYLVRSPAVSIPLRMPAATQRPAIVPRATWGANESIRRAPPSFAPAVRFAVVHHTAGRNGYTRAEAPAIVRGIQLYHVQGNGWNDIGYNFLVDRFGTVYEGRYGGADRNVVGAHAQGFNTGSTGVALLGTYGDQAPSRAAEAALAELLAWRLDLAHVDPLGVLTVLSGGSEKFPVSLPVLLRTVSGHRDTGYTACPGNSLYARLNDLAATASATGGPKIFEPRVDVSAEGPVRFQARLSRSLSWLVTVSANGEEVARGSGTGTKLDWTWDAVDVSEATYTWTIAAGTARPATGTVRAGVAAPALALEDASTSPAGITPNGDGQNDAALLAFSLSVSANLTVEVVDGAGTVAATVLDRVWKRAGTHSFTIDGAALPDGVYRIVVRAHTATHGEVVKELPLTVSRTLGLVSATPPLVSPNGDGRLDALDVAFSLSAPAAVTVRIERDGRWVATPVVGASYEAGRHRFRWDGARAAGQVRDGSYTAVVEVADAVGVVSAGVPFAVDATAPRIRVLPGRRLRISVSEPAVLKLWVNGRALRREARRAGTLLVLFPQPLRRARIVAWDAAGNTASAFARWPAPRKR